FLPLADVIYVWHPPQTVGLAAVLISALRRTPFVIDVQDIWPDELLITGLIHEGLAARLMRSLERLVYTRASHIIVTTEGARSNLVAKGTPPKKISVLPHWV